MRLYRGLLDRDPDAEGFEYWLDRAEQGTALDDMAHEFLASEAFRDAHPQATTDQGLVDALYHQVLDREADASGEAYWLARLDDPAFDSGDLALAFTDSEAFVAASAAPVDDYLLEHYDGGLVGVPTDLEAYLFG